MGKDPLGIDMECWSFLENFNKWDTITEVYHLGAISDTRKLISIRFTITTLTSVEPLFESYINGITVKTASSASVYGNLVHEVNPLNYYSLSKLTMDYWIEEHMSHFPLIQSFRFFNVYGEGGGKIKLGTELKLLVSSLYPSGKDQWSYQSV